jgi:hypothetical protein
MTSLKFIHIPKTAGSSMQRVLKKYMNIDPNDLGEHELPISRSHIPPSMYDIDLTKHTFFCIVRNPFDRIISDFKFWLISRNNLSKSLKADINKALLSSEYSNENLNYFVSQCMACYTPAFLDGHVTPMHTFVYKNGNQFVDHVLRFESLNEDMNKLITSLTLPIPLNTMKTCHMNSTKSVKLTLNETSIKKIQRFYRLDFALFKYDLYPT